MSRSSSDIKVANHLDNAENQLRRARSVIVKDLERVEAAITAIENVRGVGGSLEDVQVQP
jgi:hypothetical protein